MVICEFCLRYRSDGKCSLGLNIPKPMSCREFETGVERFCSNPADFKNANQIVQMATYFGLKGMELKKVKLVARQEEERRKETSNLTAVNVVEDSQGANY